jgi:protease-4
MSTIENQELPNPPHESKSEVATTSPSSAPQVDNWERDILNRLAFATLNEQRRHRRWRIFFIFLLFIYLFLIYFTVYQPEWNNLVTVDDEIASPGKHTALVEVEGIIATDTETSADKIVSGLRKAFKDKATAGIILRINSPGGSPVQAGYINDEINRLREKYPTIPVYAVITDICASGGYYIAAAADKIYADKASVVGSIGVLMNGFGFVQALDKLGIERRLLTAGEHKGFLDPFSPLKSEDIDHIKDLLNDIHTQFINAVKNGRGERLKPADEAKLFSGLVWTGEQAVNLGLVDALGSSSYVAREIIKAEKIRDFTQKPNYLDRFAERLGTTIAETLSRQLKVTGTTIQ